MEKIHNGLCPKGQVGQDGQKVEALCGMSGVGKSQLDLECAYRLKEEYKAIFQITCDTKVKLAKAFSEISTRFRFGDLGFIQNQSNVKSWLTRAGELGYKPCTFPHSDRKSVAGHIRQYGRSQRSSRVLATIQPWFNTPDKSR